MKIIPLKVKIFPHLSFNTLKPIDQVLLFSFKNKLMLQKQQGDEKIAALNQKNSPRLKCQSKEFLPTAKSSVIFTFDFLLNLTRNPVPTAGSK